MLKRQQSVDVLNAFYDESIKRSKAASEEKKAMPLTGNRKMKINSFVTM